MALFGLVGALVAVEPLVRLGGRFGAAEPGGAAGFPGWPETVGGRALERVDDDSTARWAETALGGSARVRVLAVEGGGQAVLRWVPRATRAVHASAECYRAWGYAVEEGGLVRDGAGVAWREFRAQRGAENWRVRERWWDEAGGTWTDASAWWWAAARGASRGPWWVLTVAEREDGEAAGSRVLSR